MSKPRVVPVETLHPPGEYSRAHLEQAKRIAFRLHHELDRGRFILATPPDR